ncbi:uncharacterized protein LOC113290717 [Papaver somniferum]|uniref:uncharacterized protein LOC113290717 n=1 Tax=Papaver somniferum TaxID=3469 RepID=UPI000E702D04|nr:uncharacterized protein LOC113290717 [Papaver somniferum]
MVSDHAPLFGVCASVPKPKNAPKKFQKMQIQHPNFLQVINDSWFTEVKGDPAFVFMIKLKNLKQVLNDRNWNVFGNVTVKIKEVEVKVKVAIQKSDDDPFNEDALKSLVEDQNELSSREVQHNTILKKKSRIKWDIIHKDLVAAIQFCWNRKFIPKGLNSGFLVLLLKCQGAKTAAQFRPIGLSNVIFKIITKLITSRMSTLIGKLVSPQQTAYIKGRNIQEQVLLAYEMVNAMKKKWRGENVGLKLDISQAYDAVSWEFLTKVLLKYGFSSSWCQRLLIILNSARISVMVNGGPCGFSSWKGLKAR